jgi:hypothetical protein
MKELSELSIADLAALDMIIHNSLNNSNLSMEEYDEVLLKKQLVKSEISKRLGKIDFEA